MMRKARRKRAQEGNLMNQVPTSMRFDKVARDQWPERWWDPKRLDVWLSPEYLVQVFDADRGYLRITVNRTDRKRQSAEWADKISWDDLWLIKSIIGYGASCAVEVYPAEDDLVNVANMRHLWILPEGVKAGWYEGKGM